MLLLEKIEIGGVWCENVPYENLEERHSGEYSPELASNEAKKVYRKNALKKIDNLHADFMTKLTGDATRQEVDTWPSKVAASKFIAQATDEEISEAADLVLSDSPLANEDLETLVSDIGSEPDELRELATYILKKSRAYKRLIGLASKLRRETKAAVLQATDESAPIELVGENLDQIESSMNQQAKLAIEQWSSS